MRNLLRLMFVLGGLVAIACGDDDGNASLDAAPLDAATDGTVPDEAIEMGDADVTDAPSGADDAVDAPVVDAPPSGPSVALQIDPAVVTEMPASSVTFELEVTGEIPEGGVRVYVLGDVPRSLTQLDLFNLSVDPEGNDAPVGDLDFSGFTVLLEAPVTTITLTGFADGEAEDPVDVNFRIVPFEEVPWGMLPVDNEPAAGAYVVGAPSTATLRLQDEPS
ncbi:MAG: hypothetical protein AAF411_04625 [Myxococcota bacterium]